ncbi:fimbrial protein [Providencia sneebia]|uniref:Fimbrial protein n=1 Tax=Providencia sneebia DSM 19967 TaxID=1141660 RepID=K8WU72_9GAMM|nr:hypothetical protein [Providencia sneebia]EKT60972.1 hypothetical protein OO7_02756 [Providencia sneebia DSM 19967]
MKNKSYICLLLVFLFKPAFSSELNILYMVNAIGSCDIVFNPTKELRLPPLDPLDIIDSPNPRVLSIGKVNLKLTNCANNYSRTPYLTISGTTSTDNIDVTTRPFLLKSSGQSKGFGFVIGKSSSGIIEWGEGSNGIYSFASGNVSIVLGRQGMPASELNNLSKDLYVGITCGTAKGCQSQNVNSGDLNANLVFNFSYN